MGMKKNRHARAFVNATRLDADVAVLDQVDASHAMAAADLVGALDYARRRQVFAVYRDWVAARVLDLDVLRLVGSFFGRDRQAEHVAIRLSPWVFEHATLEADMDEVAIHRIGFFRRDRNRNFLLVRVSDHIRTALEGPIRMTPRRDHF